MVVEVAWYGVACYDKVLCGMVCYGMLQYSIGRHGMVQPNKEWYGTPWCNFFQSIHGFTRDDVLTSNAQVFILSRIPLTPNGNHEIRILAVRHNNHIIYRPNAAVYSS